MEENEIEQDLIQFADFALSPSTEKVFKHGEAVKIEPQLYALLWLFIQNPHRVLSRELIEAEVWAGRPVTDEALRAAVKKLRDILDDDARAPRFIKTIPKQGFKWLMKVQSMSTVTAPLRHAQRFWQKPLLLISCFAVFVLVVSVWTTQQSDSVSKPVEANVLLTKLTSLSGSEIAADYHTERNMLAFVHRETRNSPQQLYIKYLDSGEVIRLSWDDANYSNSFWANDGRRLVFMRLYEGAYAFFVAHFDKHGIFQTVEAVEHPDLKGKYVIDWLFDDSGWLLAEEMQAGKQHRIFAFDINRQAVKPLSNPNVAARGDYKAAQSPDGRLLAILREEVAQQSTLLVTDLKTGDSVSKLVLPFFPSRLIWMPSGNQLAMSNFFGESWQFDLTTQTLSSPVQLPENSLDLFSPCGEQCFVLRQHNGNFLDLQEAPLAAIVKLQSQLSQTPLLQSGRLLKRADAQDFPQYLNNNAGLFFVSLRQRQFVLQYINAQHQLIDIATLDHSAMLTSVAVAPNNKMLIGAANGRLFTASIPETHGDQSVVPAVSFISSALERFENPIWSIDGATILAARVIGNQPQIVALDRQGEVLEVIAEQYLAFQYISADKQQAIAITTDRKAVVLEKRNATWELSAVLAEVTSASPNRWLVSSDYFYFTKHQIPEAFVCRIPLTQIEPVKGTECYSIGDNRFRLNFDIDTQRQRLMLVESLSAESDIIKLEW